MKRWVKILIYVAIIVVLVAGVVAANVWRGNSTTRGVVVKISYPGGDTLVTAAQMEQQIQTDMPWLTGQLVKNVNTQQVSEMVMQTPYASNVQTSMSIGRQIVVRFTQRRPIVRLFYDDEEFYLDSEGQYLPLSEIDDCNVMVANGSFHQKLGKNHQHMRASDMLEDSLRCHFDVVRVWQLANYLDAHPDYACLFDQIFVESNGDLYLTPKVGDHIVCIGDPDNLDEKFHNLMVLYLQGFSQVGWGTYSKINLKYHDQVICTKSTNK